MDYLIMPLALSKYSNFCFAVIVLNQPQASAGGRDGNPAKPENNEME